MAEQERTEIKSIDWREVFDFPHLFRTFRLAIHPSKLIIALGAIILCYLAGGFLDIVWGPQVYHKEIDHFVASPNLSSFRQQARERRYSAYRDRYHLIRDYDIEEDRKDAKKVARRPAKSAPLLYEAAYKEYEKNLTAAENDYKKNLKIAEDTEEAEEESDEEPGAEAVSMTAEKARESYLAAIALAETQLLREYQAVEQAVGRPIWESFSSYMSQKFNAGIRSILTAKFAGGVLSPAAESQKGVVAHLRDALLAVFWLIVCCPVNFIIMVVLLLIIWAVAGGAICRIAALQAARDEKIALKQALKFSGGKFLSFLFAPIIPLAILFVISIFLWLGGLVGAIPYVGEILVGLLFFLTIMAGFVMTLILLGCIGGFNMMYPTIAVEGSDSFDAISRSFSYVYSRPWRTGFYTLVLAVYGAACYLFVRFFAYLLLQIIHVTVDTGMSFFGLIDGSRPGMTKLAAMWQSPMFTDLTRPILYSRLSGTEAVAAFIINLWVLLIVGMVLAFIISFYFSGHTVMYYLLRRKVDATDMEDVFVEEEEEPLLPEQPAEEEGAEEKEEEKSEEAEQGPEEKEGEEEKSKDEEKEEKKD
jgi:hypothetical protein